MSPKAQIEAALSKAILAVLIEHVVKGYVEEAGDAAMLDDVPMLMGRVRAWYTAGLR